MNPIPVSWCAIGGGVLLVLGIAGGWTVRDWKRDSEVLAGLEKAIEKVDAQRGVIDAAAAAYEQEKQDAGVVREGRDTTIREIYRDRVVSPDCAAPPTVSGVLGAAIVDANARAAGQPAPGLPTPAKPANTAD